MIGEKGLRRMKVLPDVLMVFSYELDITVAVANGRSTLVSQQTYLLTFSVLTASAPVDMKLAVAVLARVDDICILGWWTMCKQLNIDILKGLKAQAVGSGVMETDDQIAARRADTSGDVSAWDLSTFLPAVQRIVDREEGVSEKN